MSKEIVKIPLIETYDTTDGLKTVASLVESANPINKEKLSRVDGKYIIGMIEGEAFIPDGVSRNKRFYSRPLWEKQLKRFNVQEAFKTSTMFGEIGHSEGPITDIVLRHGYTSHFVDELWINEEGKGMGRYYILNTPTGQYLKTYMGAGCKLKVSTRGVGTLSEKVYEPGCPYVDEDSYELQTVDFVINPGFLQTNPRLQEDIQTASLEVQKLAEEFNNIQKGENDMSLDAENFVRETIESQKLVIGSLNEQMSKANENTVSLQENIQSLTEELNTFKKLNMTPEQIDEALSTAKTVAGESEAKIKDLQESVDVYIKKAGSISQLDEATRLSTKAVLALSKYQDLGSYQDLAKLIEMAEMAKNKLQETKKFVKTALKMKSILEQYKQFGTLEELKTLKESAETLVESNLKKKAFTEATKISEEFSHPIESVARLAKKLGFDETRKFLASMQESKKPVETIKKKDLLEEEKATLDKANELPAEKYFKKGLLGGDFNVADYNKEAQGETTEQPLLGIKPINSFVKKLSGDYKDLVPKAEKVVDEKKPKTPEQVEKEIKAELK